MRKSLIFITTMVLFLQQGKSQPWDMNGNTLPPRPQPFLGSLNLEPLRFKTGSLQRMIINPQNGFVGMGVNDPQNPLQVHANDKRPSYDKYLYEYKPGEPETVDGYKEPDICDRSGGGKNYSDSSGTIRGNGIEDEEEDDGDGEDLVSYSAIQVTNCVTGKEVNKGVLLSMENRKAYLRQLESDNFNISMKGNDVITVTTSLNVGIGTNIPRQKLHVVDGNILISRSPNGNPPGCQNGMIMFGSNNVGINGEYNGHWGIEYVNSATEGYGLNFCKLWNMTQSGFNHTLFIADDGNVGIGKKDPQHKLDVNGNIGVHRIWSGGGLEINYTATEWWHSASLINHTATTDWSSASLIKVDRNLSRAISVVNTGVTPEKEVFTIWGNGIVNAKKIYAEEFEIHPNAMGIHWFDHVFAPDYKLMSLSELEAFIKTNKHLPEIPSEKEVQENGINLGEMQGKLLLKIEELTLHIIELQKQIDELKQTKKGGE